MFLSDVILNNYIFELQEIKDKDLIKDIQANLTRAGYTLNIDGICGEKTLLAFGKFKKDFYLEHPTQLGKTTAKVLTTLPSIQNKYFLPTAGIGWLSSPFGKRARGYHKGVDIAANEGTPVYAVATGIVKVIARHCQIGDFSCGGGYGNCIYLEHKNLPFDESRYAHLFAVVSSLEIGSLVSKSRLIGYVGNTGHSFGPHLHFEVRKSNKYFNPLSVINPIV